MLRQKFINTIQRYRMLAKGDKILLGVSGGPDSLALLDLFLEIQKEYRLKLTCAHFNHFLRIEADAEEKFVMKKCADAEIKLITGKKEVKKFFAGDSLEQTARNFRYEFFVKTCRQEKIKKIVLAHHKDDLAETVLMRLIRGSGLRGLRGFLPVSRYRGLTIIRPLIDMRKQDLIARLSSKKIDFCVDQSNFDTVFLRNKIRLKLIPLLEEMNSAIVDTLAVAAESIACDYQFICRQAQEAFERLQRKESAHAVELNLIGLEKLDSALFNHVIRCAIEQIKGNTREFEIRHMDEVRDLVFNRPQESVVDVPGIVFQKKEKYLIVRFISLENSVF